jgi:hypothetical protein
MTALNLKSRKYETKKSAKRLLTKPDSKYYKQDTLPAGGMNSLSLTHTHTHCVTLRIKTETESTKVQLYLIDTIIEHLKKKTPPLPLDKLTSPENKTKQKCG